MMGSESKALISVYGKPLIATLRDGGPEALGKRLVRSNKNPDSVVDAARKHGIYFLVPAVFSDEEWTTLAVHFQKVRHPEGVFNSERYLGWGRYHYDIQGDTVMFRDLTYCQEDTRTPLPRMKRLFGNEQQERRW